ncbi:MAG: ribosome small subunit-dependent GTPase A [Anaerolineales bacterium]|nr:ribosome small subunit-dependent GTPase A [Chloroflexota bacterium]MBL6980266.1 ribosome small subunit-dependent GTPase A [Anaerolineales bacterium]
MKQGRKTGDIIAVGDWVLISRLDDGSGMIEEIEERRSMFSRMAPTPRGEYQQILIANPDQAVFVFACTDPDPHLRMLDRFLIVAEQAEIPSLIVFNKVDLIGLMYARKWYGHYKKIGYQMLFTSATTGRGVKALRKRLEGKVSVLAGPSGAGKSSLLNAVQPELGLVVRDVSKATRKGRHTTVVREMFPLDKGGYVADTPGLKAMALWDIEPEEVDGYFPELRDLVADCKFSNCMHLHEPGCAVKAAVEEGSVHDERYESYIRLRYGEDDE